jgi:hypothetical protein
MTILCSRRSSSRAIGWTPASPIARPQPLDAILRRVLALDCVARARIFQHKTRRGAVEKVFGDVRDGLPRAGRKIQRRERVERRRSEYQRAEWRRAREVLHTVPRRGLCGSFPRSSIGRGPVAANSRLSTARSMPSYFRAKVRWPSRFAEGA